MYTLFTDIQEDGEHPTMIQNHGATNANGCFHLLLLSCFPFRSKTRDKSDMLLNDQNKMDIITSSEETVTSFTDIPPHLSSPCLSHEENYSKTDEDYPTQIVSRDTPSTLSLLYDQRVHRNNIVSCPSKNETSTLSLLYDPRVHRNDNVPCPSKNETSMILNDFDSKMQVASNYSTTSRQENHPNTEEGYHPCILSSDSLGSVPFRSSQEVHHGDTFLYSKVAAVKVIKKLEHYINRVFSLQEELDENEISFNIEKSLRQSLENKLIIERNAVGAIKETFKVQNESSSELIEWLQKNLEDMREELVDSKACVVKLKENHEKHADKMESVVLCESKILDLQAELVDANKKLSENKKKGSVKPAHRASSSSRGRSTKVLSKKPFKC